MHKPTPDTYKAALQELDGLLNELEKDDVDIDSLAEKVERAATLLKFCRGRLSATESKVKEIVASLDEKTQTVSSASAAMPQPEEVSL